MNPANRVPPAAAAVVTQQYESLRANALGAVNHACHLTLFLRHGMSVWLRALNHRGFDQRATEAEPASVAGAAEEERPGTALAAILADAILDQARVAGARGANQ